MDHAIAETPENALSMKKGKGNCSFNDVHTEAKAACGHIFQ